MEYNRRRRFAARALALAALAVCLPAPLCVRAQVPAADTAPVAPMAERYLLHVEVPEVPIYEKPDATALLVGRLEQGVEVEADRKTGDWYRIKRASGEEGWVLNATVATGTAILVRLFPADRRIDYQAGSVDPRVPQSVPPGKLAERTEASKTEEPRVERRRPQSNTLEPRLPLIDPSRVVPPSPLYLSEEMPVRDRWRLVKSLGLLPYKPLDPYNPNVIKGDLPVLEKELGKDWFFNLTAVSDTVIEGRRLPTPTGVQSTLDPGANGTFGRGRQASFAETGIISLALIKGDTTFKPPEYEFRFVPVFNINRTITQEVRAVNINPAFGADRNDSFAGVQELFFDKHLRDVSTRYDFDSVRIGIQPFTADFRGFLFLDQPFGVRLFGTRDNNQWQYNAGWFRRLEKDTNSGLNDIGRRMRADDIFLFNVYRQDSLIPGFTSQGTILYNRNREGDRSDFYNENGFLERPAVFGTGRAHNYDVTYLGYNGDGHIGKWNVTASAYYAIGTDDRGMFSGRREDIGALFGAIEVSRDFDWVRVRASGLYASGDKDPYDGKAQGFDSVLENPQFAGADTSYWIRQAVPLIGGGGVALSMRNGVLPALRSSREFGQSNFTNPGLHLIGIGADFDVKPGLRVISNVNYLEFDDLSSLAVLRNQKLHSTQIGVDASVGVQYRPHFTQNIVVNASMGVLFPGRGLREIYGNAVDSTQYSALINILLTF
ncbi:MAG: SH3 domain-containing protein [Burkholderiales bacterium]|nr:SH3 domain-containing protein [Burkholderiales bacterium]